MSGTGVWVVIGLVALVSFALKGAGPLVLGGRELPPRLVGVVVLLPSAVLAALVVTTGMSEGQDIRVGATTAGVAVGGLLVVARAPVLLAVVAAAAVTAGLRAAGLP